VELAWSDSPAGVASASVRLFGRNVPRFLAALFGSAFVGGIVQGIVASAEEPSGDWTSLALRWGLLSAIGGTLIALVHFLPAAVVYLAIISRVHRGLSLPRRVLLGATVFGSAYLIFFLLLAVGSGDPAAYDWPTAMATLVWTALVPGLLCGFLVRPDSPSASSDGTSSR
jgi:hypothetical protein